MANVTYTVPNKNGSYDGDMVVKQYTTIDVDSGDVVTTDQPCRGLFLLSQGNVNISGEIRMRGRGASANPTSSGGSDSNAVDSNGLRFPFLTSGGSSSLTAQSSLLNGCGTTARSVIANFKTLSSDGTILTLVRQGANGGSSISPPSYQTGSNDGNTGSNGSTGQTGGGGGGSAQYTGTSGAGSYGSCFSGGSGGGSIDDGNGGNYGGAGGSTSSATAWGGAGGNSGTGHGSTGSGGAGNPTGNGYSTSNGSTTATAEGGGTGGLLIIVAGGNVTINSNGKINCDGGRSEHTINNNDWCTTGGASGGGNIIIAHKGSYTNNGSVTANGGIAGKHYQSGVGSAEATATYTGEGGAGGNGSIQTLQIT